MGYRPISKESPIIMYIQYVVLCSRNSLDSKKAKQLSFFQNQTNTLVFGSNRCALRS